MAISGSIKTKLPTWQDVLLHTNGGYSVFLTEIPGLILGKSFCSPIRKDKNPSCSLSCKNGVWFMRDFSTGESYTALQLVERKYGLSFLNAINKMAQEYGLTELKNKEYSIQQLAPAPIHEENETQISFVDRKWRREHYKYWENTRVDQEHCLKYDMYAVKDLAINRKRVSIGDREVVWMYYEPALQKCKVYFPERKRKDGERWKTNIKGNFLWYIDKISECDRLFICKSNKDAILMAAFDLCVTAVQSENIANIDNNVETLDKKAKTKVVVFGQDEQGWNESFKITKKHNYKYFNIPQKELELGLNDPFSYSKYYGDEALEKLLKMKKFI